MFINIVKGPAVPLRRVDSTERAKLFTAAQRAACRHADNLVEEARHDAERLLASARAEAARIAAEEREKAEREGARRWSDAAISLARAREASLASLEREALALALEIARRIVGSVVGTSDEAWADLIVTSTNRLRRDATLTIRHSIHDTDRLRVVRDRLSAFHEVTFEADESLEVGDCIAECSGVRVDARLDVQLAAIERLLWSAPKDGERP